MNTVLRIITRIPRWQIGVMLVYLVSMGVLKWGLHPTASVIWYILGGFVGLFFFDAAEELFHLSPSPFRSLVFLAAFMLVSIFMITSSGSVFGSGVVLLLACRLLLLLLDEWHNRKSIQTWFALVRVNPTVRVSRLCLWVYGCAFVLLSLIFVRM